MATSENVTRDGIEVRPGQIWEDCDKRSKGRRVTVTKVESGKAHVTTGVNSTRIAIRRMYPHASGFRLIHDAPGGGAS